MNLALTTKYSPILDHVAVLVKSVPDLASKAANFGFKVGPIDEFPSEGTREVYIGAKGQLGRLLLVEAIKEGPYTRALQNRGTGLHHLGIRVKDLEGYIDSLAGSGWFMLPQSISTIKKKTAWLCRPGIPTLIEVFESDADHDASMVIETLEIPVGEANKLVDALGVASLSVARDDGIWLTINHKRINISYFLA